MILRLTIALLTALVSTACVESNTSVLEGTDESPVSPPVHVGENVVEYLRVEHGGALFAGQEHTIDPESPFRSVSILGTGSIPSLEFALSVDGVSDSWETVDIEEYDDGFWQAVLLSDDEADTLRLRGDAPDDFIRLEFFSEPLTIASTFDSAVDGFENVMFQAAAVGGRWALPTSTRDIGQTMYVPYTGAGNRCTGSLLPGSSALGRFLVANFPGARTYQGYNCRKIVGGNSLSMHAVGRAIDVFVPTDGGQADNGLGDPVGNYLVENAEALGIQFIIWDRTKWNASYSGSKDRYYGGAHPHHDHLHIELTPSAAAQNRTTFPNPTGFNGAFSDDDGMPSEAAFDALHAAGVINGCGESRACPNGKLTRGQLASLLARALKLPSATTDYFNDDNGTTHEKDINKLAKAGITSGCSNDGKKYCPARTVSRGEFVTMIARAYNVPNSPWDFFTDDAGHFSENSLNAARLAGLLRGCTDDRACPTQEITRGESAIVLARAMGLVGKSYRGYFTDDEGNVHETNINEARSRGWIRGCDTAKFCPSNNLTRAQAATILARAMRLPASQTDAFTDDEGSVHEDNINKIAAAGITVGCGNNKFCPGESLTRGELAVFFARALNLPPANNDYFDDDDGLFFEGAANQLKEAQITQGCGVRQFCGTHDTKRDQAATLFVRAFD